MSETPPQSEAQRRAAARKAKILQRGNAGLNKLAQTARGDEADKLYGESAPSRPKTPSTPLAETPSHSGPRQPAPNPEAQAMAAQMEAMMSMFGGPPGQGQQGMPDMQQMLAAMMGDGSGQNLLGDLDDPAGLGGLGGGGPPGANPFEAMGMGMPGMGGMPGMMMGPKPISKVERYFPLIHALSIISLLAFVVSWWEPSVRASRWGHDIVDGVLGQSASSRWAVLAGKKDIWNGVRNLGRSGIQALPIFWAFATLELILQTTRFTILKVSHRLALLLILVTATSSLASSDFPPFTTAEDLSASPHRLKVPLVDISDI